jgi:hypothetical protein
VIGLWEANSYIVANYIRVPAQSYLGYLCSLKPDETPTGETSRMFDCFMTGSITRLSIRMAELPVPFGHWHFLLCDLRRACAFGLFLFSRAGIVLVSTCLRRHDRSSRKTSPASLRQHRWTLEKILRLPLARGFAAKLNLLLPLDHFPIGNSHRSFCLLDCGGAATMRCVPDASVKPSD